MTPNLSEFRWVVVNSSAGKDSQTALAATVAECVRQGYPLAQVVVSHQCLGRSEWKKTLELAREQAEHYGLRFEVSKRRDKDKKEETLLEYVRRRKKWPDNKNRFCTSDFKRGPGGRVITALFQEAAGDILQVFGFRASESPARAKKQVWSQDARLSTQSRRVMVWLPIHHLSDQEVWDSIKASGVPFHYAYTLGMKRLSCVFCIFAPENALKLAGQHNPDLLQEYVDVEKETGHDFQHKKPLAEIQAALQRGETAGPQNEEWNM